VDIDDGTRRYTKDYHINSSSSLRMYNNNELHNKNKNRIGVYTSISLRAPEIPLLENSSCSFLFYAERFILWCVGFYEY
jgi:hypothetical protein